ncbi:MAG: hypothetical protein ACFCUL_07790 [Flavobacteriaceae bacterium]
MEEKDRNLARFMRLNGFVMPISEDEIEAFEEKFKKTFAKPKNWNSPLEILKNGKTKKINLDSVHIPTQISDSLSMAAREGKEISKELRKKMNEDRKNADNDK